jgi:DNA-binding MarR family transcriptional regulator
MRKEHLKLNEKEQSYLTTLTTSGELKARQFKRAMTLVWLSEGKTMSEVSRLLDYAYPSVVNVKKNFLQSGLASLEEKPRTGRPVTFEGTERAKITALACSETPGGRAKWSLRLLADKAVELDLVRSISHTQVQNILKKMN